VQIPQAEKQPGGEEEAQALRQRPEAEEDAHDQAAEEDARLIAHEGILDDLPAAEGCRQQQGQFRLLETQDRTVPGGDPPQADQDGGQQRHHQVDSTQGFR